MHAHIRDNEVDTTMKSLQKILIAYFKSPAQLAWLTLFTLLLPNMILDITESSSTLWKIVNIALPAGLYLLILGASRRTGWMVLCLMPAMILAAFQIVLLWLYGESIIAVDMFLNVVTTSMSEATELLENLLPAICIVVIAYLPPLIWAIYQICRGIKIERPIRKKMVMAGAALTVAGTAIAATAILRKDKGDFRHDVFPINVIANLSTAVERTESIAHYPETSAAFTYHARSLRNAADREIYVYVIGETSRAINWQLGGYERPTNPRLSKEPNVVFFSHAVSESNTTHKSVPMLMSYLNAEDFKDVNNAKSILTAMKEAGYHTAFFSNQAPNRSYVEHFGKEADDMRYTDAEARRHPYDEELLDMLRQSITDTTHRKQFIVLHTYGSHFRYKDRYPENFAYFKPDDAKEATVPNRKQLINAYDNSIRYTDHILASIIDELRNADCPTAMLYSADHGEDIFDDARNRFLHASPNPTYYQLHVAMLAWLSDRFREQHPEMEEYLKDNCSRAVSPQRSMFNTALDICGVYSPLADHTKSLVGASYTASDPVYLTDLNEAVNLGDSGLKDADRHKLRKVLKIRNAQKPVNGFIAQAGKVSQKYFQHANK